MEDKLEGAEFRSCMPYAGQYETVRLLNELIMDASVVAEIKKMPTKPFSPQRFNHYLSYVLSIPRFVGVHNLPAYYDYTHPFVLINDSMKRVAMELILLGYSSVLYGMDSKRKTKYHLQFSRQLMGQLRQGIGSLEYGFDQDLRVKKLHTLVLITPAFYRWLKYAEKRSEISPKLELARYMYRYISRQNQSDNEEPTVMGIALGRFKLIKEEFDEMSEEYRQYHQTNSD